ncbi:MAG: hypothetical protein L0Y72_24545 [Gemmataceae bacterium]|nr:hypothetical protein [Gemmataceae bacterium]
MIKMYIRITEITERKAKSCIVTVEDYSWYEWDSDAWRADRKGSIGKDNYGKWDHVKLNKKLKLRDSSGEVLVLDNFNASPQEDDEGTGFHNTPNKRIHQGLVEWKIGRIT